MILHWYFFFYLVNFKLWSWQDTKSFLVSSWSEESFVLKSKSFWFCQVKAKVIWFMTWLWLGSKSCELEMRLENLLTPAKTVKSWLLRGYPGSSSGQWKFDSETRLFVACYPFSIFFNNTIRRMQNAQLNKYEGAKWQNCRKWKTCEQVWPEGQTAFHAYTDMSEYSGQSKAQSGKAYDE